MNRVGAAFMYLRVKHAQKRRYDLIYPIGFAGLVGSFLVFAPTSFNILGERGLVETFNGLLGILIGFFITALAAVATFDRPGMDALMRGDPATLALAGRKEPLALTRRMYLCLLFGHLTFASLSIFVASSLVNVMFANTDATRLGLTAEIYQAVRVAFVYGYCFALGHVLSHSLLGVYYLAWRAVIVDKAVLKPPTV